MAEPKWNRVSDVRAFLSQRGRRVVGTHSPKKIKCIPWPVCSRCGLVYLKNDVTARAIRAKCVTEE